MRNTVPEGYPFPVGGDHAAMAAQLQALASAGDARYAAVNRDDFGLLAQYLRAPTIVMRSVPQQGPFFSASMHAWQVSFPTVVFANTPVVRTTTGVELPTVPGGRERCWFHAGASIACQPVGATNVDTIRQLGLGLTTVDPITGALGSRTWWAREFETTAAAQVTRLHVGAFFSAYVGEIDVFFAHANTSSDMNVLANTASLWITRIAPQPQEVP